MNDAELLALIAIVNAERTEVVAANADRERRGEAMAYDGFPDLDGALKRVVDELKRRKIL